MISDEKRREVARKLREDAANDKLREQVFVEEIIAGCIGETMYDEWGNVKEVEILTRFADLIDRPTTTRHGKFRTKYGRETPCCELCGYSIGDTRWGYCPKCGARIIEVDDGE